MVSSDSLWQKLIIKGSPEMGLQELERLREVLIYHLEEIAAFRILMGMTRHRGRKTEDAGERGKHFLRKEGLMGFSELWGHGPWNQERRQTGCTATDAAGRWADLVMGR